MIIRHALYVASLEEGRETWLRRLEPLLGAGLVRLDLTAVLAPEAFWRSVPSRVRQSVMSRTRSPVVKHLWQLLGDVHLRGLEGRIVLDGLPSHERALDAAVTSAADILVVRLPADSTVKASGFLHSSIPVLLLRGGCSLDPELPTMVSWNHPLECSAMLEVLKSLTEAGVVPTNVQLLRCGGDTGRDDAFGTVAASALHERLQSDGFEVHSSWAAGSAASAALDAACNADGGLVIVTQPEARGPHDPWDRAIVERMTEGARRPVLVLPPVPTDDEDLVAGGEKRTGHGA